MRDKLDWNAWSQDLSVGIAVIDDDHRQILDLIATLHGAYDQPHADQAVRAVLEAIADYSEQHFGREERMLARAGYSFLAQHRARHDVFRAHVAALRHESPLPQAGELLSWLVDWWIGHIGTEDKAYRAHMAAHPDEGR